MNPPEAYVFGDDGRFPNSRYPVLVYRQVPLPAPSGQGSQGWAQFFEHLFSMHAWPAAWNDGIYTRHHFHSTAHEVLGVHRGWVQARLGGEVGKVIVLRAGDAVVIPAGVAHCNEAQSNDLGVVGAYPEGSAMDMNYGDAGERPRADGNILALSLPAQDPIYGAGGPLLGLWASV